jgi:hypothetical protein
MAVQDIKREIIDTQKATITSGQRSLQMVGAGTESAMNIAQALARQREHLDNAERNIDNSCKCPEPMACSRHANFYLSCSQPHR